MHEYVSVNFFDVSVWRFGDVKKLIGMVMGLAAVGAVRAATCTFNDGWDVEPSGADDEIVIASGALTWDDTLPAKVASWSQTGGTVTFKGETLIGKLKPATALTFKPAGDNTLTVNFKGHAGFLTPSDGRDIRFFSHGDALAVVG